jgi:hypothetical protein
LLAVLILIAVFAFRIKAVIDIDNGDIVVSVFFVRIIKLQKKYVIKHEPDVLLKLYLRTRKGLKPVIGLPEVITKIKKTVATDIAFIDAITVFLQSLRKKQKKSAFNYIYRKARFNIGIDIKLGIEDAFLTAIVCGILNAASGAACAIYNSEKREVNVRAYPDFSNMMFWIKANCIIKLAPADIIIGYVIYKKNKNRR